MSAYHLTHIQCRVFLQGRLPDTHPRWGRNTCSPARINLEKNELPWLYRLPRPHLHRPGALRGSNELRQAVKYRPTHSLTPFKVERRPRCGGLTLASRTKAAVLPFPWIYRQD